MSATLNNSAKRSNLSVLPSDPKTTRYSDIDLNKHMNNARYLEWVMDLLPQNVLEKYFKENANTLQSSRGEDWINYTPPNSDSNIIMFGSGYGDGIYPRYVGFDKNKQVVKFIVDFIQLTDETEE